MALIAPTTYIQVVEASESTLEEQVVSAAEEVGISTTTLFNLAWSESRLNPQADNGKDRGIVQISRQHHPEVSDWCSFSAPCALRWAAERIKAGYSYEWTVCNCYSYVSLFERLPRMGDLVPNATPAVGRVAVFQYKVKHIAVITKLEERGFWVKEANYKPCLVGERFVGWGDKALLGFWSP